MDELIERYYQEEKLLKAKEVAQLLNISRALTYHLMQNGQIPVVRINRAVRVMACDLRSYIEKQRVIS